MKKVRLILPILTAVFLLVPGMAANAEPRITKFAAGTETGKITIHLWDLQTLEGVVKVEPVDEGEIHLESITITTNDPANTEVCDTSGNKVYMSSNGIPVKTSITINLSFVEDGEYLVTLTGGCTTKSGKYNAKGLDEEQSIIVGAEKTEEVKAETKTENTSSLPITTETKTEEKAEEETMDENTEDGTAISIRNPQALEIDQEDDEDLEELAKEAEKAEKKKKAKDAQTSSNLLNILRIVLSVLGLIGLVVGGYFMWKRENAVEEEDYEGAATLDYDIEDDDMGDDDIYDDAYEDEEE